MRLISKMQMEQRILGALEVLPSSTVTYSNHLKYWTCCHDMYTELVHFLIPLLYSDFHIGGKGTFSQGLTNRPPLNKHPYKILCRVLCKQIELTVHTSCYWELRLTLCYRDGLLKM